VLAILPVVQEALAVVRAGRPAGLVLHTYRFAAHSKGDDVRAPAEVAAYKAKDPLTIHAERLPQAVCSQLARLVDERLEIAFAHAEADPFPVPASLRPIPERLP